MDNYNNKEKPFDIPSHIKSIKEAESDILDFLKNNPVNETCALIRSEIDKLPESNEAITGLFRKIDIALLHVLTEHNITGRSDSTILILIYGIRSYDLARLQIEQLCDILSVPYEEHGFVNKAMCACGVVVWNYKVASEAVYFELKDVAIRALNEQRSHSLQGYTMIESKPDGIGRKSLSGFLPSLMFEEMGIGILVLQGYDSFLCIYCSRSSMRLLDLFESGENTTADKLFTCLRTKDRSALRMILTYCITENKLDRITCRTKKGQWLLMQILPVGARRGRDTSLYISISDSTDKDENLLEAYLMHKKLELLSHSDGYSTFEVDIATHKTVFSQTLKMLCACKMMRPDGAPHSCIGCGHCINRSSAEAFQTMYKEICSQRPDGSADLGIRNRLTDGFIPVHIEWKKVYDDHGTAVKVIGAMHTNLNGSPGGYTDLLSRLQAQLALEETYFHCSEEYLETLRKYRHNRKNTVLSLTALLQEGRTDAALDYLSQMNDELLAITPIINTGNLTIDAMISNKLSHAMKSGVNVSHTIGLRPNLSFNMMDLCLAVGSCLDNAIEASEKVKEAGGRPFIDFKLVEQKSVIVMKMTNSYVPSDSEVPPYETSKPDKVNHGFGIKSLKHIVEKYSGILLLDHTESSYTTAFTLYV